MTDTVTVFSATPRAGVDRVTITFTRLPGHVFGPLYIGEAVTELVVSALLSRLEARNLVLDALATGEATTETR